MPPKADGSDGDILDLTAFAYGVLGTILRVSKEVKLHLTVKIRLGMLSNLLITGL